MSDFCSHQCEQHDDLRQCLERIEKNTSHLSALEGMAEALANVTSSMSQREERKPLKSFTKFIPTPSMIAILVMAALLVIKEVGATGVSVSATPNGGFSVEANNGNRPAIPARNN